MSQDQFWELIDKARALADSPDDADGAAEAAVELLRRRPRGEVAGAINRFGI